MEPVDLRQLVAILGRREELLEDETMLRKVFESDLVVAIDSSHSLIQTTIREIPLFILPNVYISAN